MDTGAKTNSRIALLALLSGLALTGCKGTADALAPKGALNPRQTIHQGYVFDEQSLDFVPVGSSREQVLLALGSPTTTATFDNEVFYYISQQRVRSAAFAKARLVDQRILAVYFGADGRVENIAAYGMKDGKVFDFIKKVTPTGGKDQTFIGQILGGLGGKATPKLPGAGG